MTIIQEYKNLSDGYLQARAQDWEDVGNRVGQLLTKNLVKSLVLTESVILVADDLTPSQVAQLDISKVVGLCMVRGSTSHAAILAHAIAEGLTTEKALEIAINAAELGMKNTIPLIAKKGRASYLGERSINHQDPGATSVYLLLLTLEQTLNVSTTMTLTTPQ